MTTVFDVITVTCFISLVLAFLRFSDRDPWTLLRLLLAVLAFAVANQLGNHGFIVLSALLILAGIGWSLLVIRR